MLNITFLLYCMFKASNATGFNKQLQVINLSEGQWLLHFASVLNSDRNLHPIADLNITKYAKFHQYLHQFVFGDNIMQNNKMGLTPTANVIIADLAKKADVIFITPDVVLQICAHSINAAHAVFYNKAEKMSKLNSLAGFA